MQKSFGWLTVLCTVVALGCGNDKSCKTGEERCDCYGNKTCNSGLACRSGHCVDLGDSGASGSSGSGVAQGVPLQDLCNEIQGAICGYYRKCDYERILVAMTGVTCEENFECDGAFEREKAAVSAGRMAYDEEAARRSLNEIRNADCLEGMAMFEDGVPLKYETIFTGQVAKGDDCYDSNECAKGLYCNLDQACPGQCQPFKQLGDPCQYSEECDESVANCNSSQQVCVKRFDEGKRCAGDDECKEGLKCDHDASPPVCMRPGSEGDACNSREGCLGVLHCEQNVCTAPAGRGEACRVEEFDTDMLFACKSGLYCNAGFGHGETEGTCQPQKSAGKECIYFVECAPGLLCLGLGLQIDPTTGEVSPGICGPPLEVGDRCNPELDDVTECDIGLYCDSASVTCRAYPRLGDPCTYGESPDCRGDRLYCDSLQDGQPGTCREQKVEGKPCSRSDECESGNCQDGKCRPLNPSCAA